MKRMLYKALLVGSIFLAKQSSAQDTSVVYFDFDKAVITTNSNTVLNEILSRPNLYNIKIYGHTDQLGSDGYNKRLSEKRAAAVKNYFTAKGVDAKKITFMAGYGEDKPAVALLDAVSRQANRRVVIVADYEVTAKDSVVMETTVTKEATSSSTVNEPTIRKEEKDLISQITDSSIKTGDNIILPRMNFYGGRHVFLPASYDALNELLNAMISIPTLEIEIQGHICCQDGAGDGLDIDTGEPFLSYNRAKAVYNYLLQNGISEKRMKFRGFGHQFPIIMEEKTEAEKTINRRVEIKILKK